MSQLTVSELLQEAEWRRCANDEQYWIEKYVHIRHPEQGRIPFHLRPSQEEILDTWAEERYTISLKARQIGWSTIVAVHCLWLCLFRPDTPIIMLSRTEREATRLLEMAKYAYTSLPSWMKDRGPALTDRHQLRMTFDNNSKIESLPSKKDPARGATAYLVVVDEWAFLENPEEAWAAIEPVADVGGRIIGLSTANGAGNFFHDFYVKAERGESAFKALFFPWWSVPERDDAWYEEQKRSKLPWQLAQEYPNDPVEAFVQSGRPVFDHEMLDRQVLGEPMRGYIETAVSKKRPDFRTQEDGALTIYKFPEVGHRYVVGADVAQGLEHGDFSSAHVIDADTDEVVAHLHLRIDTDLFAQQLYSIGFWYNTALLAVEANNHGHSVLADLKRLVYPRLYFQRRMDERTQKLTKKVGWHTYEAAKARMVDDLNRELREGTLRLNDEPTKLELGRYQRDDKGRMSGSPHDDRVISLCISNQMRPLAGAAEFSDPGESDYFSFDWHLRKADDEESPDALAPLGSHNLRLSR